MYNLQSEPKAVAGVTGQGYCKHAELQIRGARGSQSCLAMVDSGNLWRTIISPAFLRKLGYTLGDLRPVPGLTRLGTAKKGATLGILGQLKHNLAVRFEVDGTIFKVCPVVVEGLTMDMNLSGPFLKMHRIDQIHSQDSLKIQGRLIPLVTPRQERRHRHHAAALLLDPGEDRLVIPPQSIATVMARLEHGEVRREDGVVDGCNAFDEKYGVHTWREVLARPEDDGRVAVHVMNVYHKEVVIPDGEEMGTFRSIRTSPDLHSPPKDKDPNRRVLLIDMPSINSVQKEKAPVSNPDGVRSASDWTPEAKKAWIRAEFKLDQSPCLKTIADREQASLLLLKYFDVFSVDGEFGTTDLVKHCIDTGDTAPIRLRNRPLNPVLEADLDKQLNKWLKHGVIEPAESPWNFALVAAPKKGGKIRWCVDFRRLNLATRKDAFPLPSIEDNLARLARSKVFSAIDGCGAFHVIEMDKNDRAKTAFSTPRGQFQFVRMPFGLTNAPATYSRLVQKVLNGIPLDLALPYLDDTAIHTATLASHFKALARVLDAHRAAGLKLQPSKCQLFRDHIEYLGHLVSPRGIQTLPSHTKVIKDWPIPKTRPEARSFIGKISYYRKFIKDFSALAGPWTDVMNKNSAADDRIPLTITESMTASFYELRDLLVSAPILGYPQFDSDEPFVLDTDWSGDHRAIGAVLSQKQDGQERVIAYGSKKLNNAQASYTANRGELYAIIYFLNHFKYYLLYRPFILRTDHHALQWIYTMQQPASMILRWLETLANFEFTVKHRPGTSHGNADALSRVDHGDAPDGESKDDEMAGISIYNLWTHSLWDGHELLDLQREDGVLKVIRSILVNGDVPSPLEEKALDERYRTYKGILTELFLDEDGILCRRAPNDDGHGALANRHRRRVCLPQELWDHVIGIQHETGGHMGRDNTLDRVRSVVYFPRMKAEVSDYIQRCENCRQKQKQPPAQMHTLVSQNAGYPFQRISVDFVGPLPMSQRGNTYLLTVKDIFSKWVEAFPIPAQTAEIAANTLHREVFARFGLPEVIHSDNGRQFVGRIWMAVGDRLGIRMTRTPSYNPKSNPVERAHRDLNGMLKSLSAGNPAGWEEHVPAALFALRTTVNASTKYAPYRLLFGRDPNTPIDLIFGDPPEPLPQAKRKPGRPAKVPYHVQWATALKEKVTRAFDFARANTHEAVLRRRRLYNKDKKYYEPDAMVWLFTPVDSTKDKVASRKLANYWTGPWRILRKVNDLTVVLIQVTPANDALQPIKEITTSIDRLAPFKPGSPAQPMLPELVLGARLDNDEFAECIDSAVLNAPSTEVPELPGPPVLGPAATSTGGWGTRSMPQSILQPPPAPRKKSKATRGRKRTHSPVPPLPAALPEPPGASAQFTPKATSSVRGLQSKRSKPTGDSTLPAQLSSRDRSRSPLDRSGPAIPERAATPEARRYAMRARKQPAGTYRERENSRSDESEQPTPNNSGQAEETLPEPSPLASENEYSSDSPSDSE